ncbi:glycogen/starch synthase [Francisella tularensis]|uniref:glycogen/starch synthase n=2 Tax=Francisella tularensis TaxID=263 RepID=UPI0004FFCF33|nr:glycogen/starch synthase [Francisella tularensis]AJJ47215.1 glycosyl transferases group 1 family protein [Francisella tularensis subsp. novicida]KFJ68827.1 glycosyl transferases group 1 family protein [Francisella tularensis subsp. novicida]
MKKLHMFLLISVLWLNSLFASKLPYEFITTPNQKIVLHAALEGHNAIVGGLGMVVKDLSLNEYQHSSGSHNYITYSIIPYYFFLKEKYKGDNIVEVATINHEVFTENRNTRVFYNDKYKQFLIEPDEQNSDMVNKPIYTQESSYLTIAYFNSAVASFANFLNVSSLHLHAWHSGLAAPLIKKKYNIERKQKGLKPIKVISHVHMLNEEQGTEQDQFLYKNLGLDYKTNEKLNIMASQIIESDFLIFVSKGLVYDYQNGLDYGLKKILDEKGTYLRSVRNGINYNNYSLFNKELYKEYSLDQNTFTNDDFNLNKTRIKEILYKENIISSKDKPLLLYIGRFSEEKGIKSFQIIIDSWLKLGGQVVLAGQAYDPNSDSHIIKLQDIYKMNEDVKIYNNIIKDQKEKLSDEVEISKGHLLRAAADWAIIPSQIESCGLIAMELLSVGTPIITSWVQGLKDTLNPYGVVNPIVSDSNNINYNSISYFYEKNMPEDQLKYEIDRAFLKAFDILNNRKEYLKISVKALKNSSDYDLKNNTLPQLYQIYDEASEDIDLKENYSLYNLEDLMIDFESELSLEQLGKEKKYSFDKKNNFLVSTASIYDDISDKDNYENIDRNSIIYNTENKEIVSKIDSSGTFIWVLDINGNFYIDTGKKGNKLCHAFICKNKNQIPKPIVCAGDIKVENGNITYIDNRSGHYKPTLDQFILALKYLDKITSVRR